MKGRIDKSMGIVTLIAEALAEIKPTEPLTLAKRAARKKRNCSGSSPGNYRFELFMNKAFLSRRDRWHF